MRLSRENRFWSIVKIATGCWEWLGAVTHNGYGRFAFSPTKTVRAHRYSWVLANGEIQDDICVLHRCDNPKCVNPAHLFFGTHKDNAQDREVKGRGRDIAGYKHHFCKVTPNDVALIRRLYASNEMSQRTLGKAFSISQAAISRIVLGQTY